MAKQILERKSWIAPSRYSKATWSAWPSKTKSLFLPYEDSRYEPRSVPAAPSRSQKPTSKVYSKDPLSLVFKEKNHYLRGLSAIKGREVIGCSLGHNISHHNPVPQDPTGKHPKLRKEEINLPAMKSSKVRLALSQKFTTVKQTLLPTHTHTHFSILVINTANRP